MTEGTMDVSRLIRASLLVVVALLGLAVLWTYLAAEPDLPSYPYSEMLADASAERVETIVQQGTQLTVTLRGTAEPRTVQVASDSVNVYAEVCAASGNAPGPSCPIQYEVVAPSETGQVLGYLISALVPVILIGAFFFFMMRAARQKKD